MNMKENSMNCYHLINDRLLGNYEWSGKLDMLNIVIIGLSKDLPQFEKKYELHRLLGALLSDSISQNEKLNIIEKEYNISIENDIREEVYSMCNLGEGIEERAINQILHHYRGYITKRSLRLMKDEYGNQSMVVDEVLRGRMETRLITKILSFEIEWHCPISLFLENWIIAVEYISIRKEPAELTAMTYPLKIASDSVNDPRSNL